MMLRPIAWTVLFFGFATPLFAQQVEMRDLPDGAKMRLGTSRLRLSRHLCALSDDGVYEVYVRDQRFVVRDLLAAKDLFDLGAIKAEDVRYSPVFSPDSKLLLRCDDKKATAWEIPSGRVHAEIAYPEGPQKEPPLGEIHGDCLLIWFGEEGNNAPPCRLWNYRTKTLSPPLGRLQSNVVCSPSGAKYAQTDDAKHELVIHDVAKKRVACRIPYEGRLGPFACFPNDEQIVLTGAFGSAHIHDARSGKLTHTLFGWKGPAQFKASRDGKKLAALSNRQLVLWDLSDPAKRTLHALPYPFTNLAFQGDNVVLATQEDYAVQRWELAKNAPIAAEPNPADWLGCLRFRSNTQLLTMARHACTLWDLRTGRALETHKRKHVPFDIAPDEKIGVQVVETDPDGNFAPRLDVIDLAADTFRLSITQGGRDEVLVPLKGGRVAHLLGNELQVLDALKGKTLEKRNLAKLLAAGGPNVYTPARFFCDDDMARAAVLAHVRGADGSQLNHSATILVDLATGKRLATFTTQREPTISISASGRLCVLRDQAELIVADLHTGGEVRRILWTNPEPISWRVRTDAGVFRSDDRLLAMHDLGKGFEDSAVVLFELASGTPRARLVGHRTEIFDLAFSPDGNTLASASKDQMVLVWDVGLRPAKGKLDLETAWRDLSKRDAAKAFAALRAFAAQPDRALECCRTRMPAARAAFDDAQLTSWLADLEHDDFAVRSKAEQQLRAIARLAESPLRQRLKETMSLETEKRLTRILHLLDSGAHTDDELRAFRAVELLETFASMEAKAQLTRWSQGHPAAILTLEAKKALARLK